MVMCNPVRAFAIPRRATTKKGAAAVVIALLVCLVPATSAVADPLGPIPSKVPMRGANIGTPKPSDTGVPATAPTMGNPAGQARGFADIKRPQQSAAGANVSNTRPSLSNPHGTARGFGGVSSSRPGTTTASVAREGPRIPTCTTPAVRRNCGMDASCLRVQQPVCVSTKP